MSERRSPTSWSDAILRALAVSSTSMLLAELAAALNVYGVECKETLKLHLGQLMIDGYVDGQWWSPPDRSPRRRVFAITSEGQRALH